MKSNLELVMSCQNLEGNIDRNGMRNWSKKEYSVCYFSFEETDGFADAC